MTPWAYFTNVTIHASPYGMGMVPSDSRVLSRSGVVWFVSWPPAPWKFTGNYGKEEYGFRTRGARRRFARFRETFAKLPFWVPWRGAT